MSNRLRVINLGLPKSGTTTLGRALKMAGLKTADYRIRAHQVKDDDERNAAFVGDLMYRGYFHTGDPLAHLEDFDGFAEISTLRGGRSLWPQMDFGLIRAIRKNHPGTRFLASRRDAFDISQSMLAWSDMGLDRLPQGTIPGLPEGYGETTKERVQWITSHYENLTQLFENDACFMEFDISDPSAAKKISAHIGIPLPWWGKVNSNPKPTKVA